MEKPSIFRVNLKLQYSSFSEGTFEIFSKVSSLHMMFYYQTCHGQSQFFLDKNSTKGKKLNDEENVK